MKFLPIAKKVSTPSITGIVFGDPSMGQKDQNLDCLNPLHNGDSLRRIIMAIIIITAISLNPLHNGDSLRSLYILKVRLVGGFSLNPLHNGDSLRRNVNTDGGAKCNVSTPSITGIVFGVLFLCRHREAPLCLNPLHNGDSLRRNPPPDIP